MEQTKKREMELYNLWYKETYEQGNSEWRKHLTQADRRFIDYLDGEYADAHCCNEEISDYGICTACGAIIRGSNADYELHGYDPDERDYEPEW